MAIMMMNMCSGQTSKVPVVRPATQANRFYTGDVQELSEEVDSLLALHRDEKVYDDVALNTSPRYRLFHNHNSSTVQIMIKNSSEVTCL